MSQPIMSLPQDLFIHSDALHTYRIGMQLQVPAKAGLGSTLSLNSHLTASDKAREGVSPIPTGCSLSSHRKKCPALCSTLVHWGRVSKALFPALPFMASSMASGKERKKKRDDKQEGNRENTQPQRGSERHGNRKRWSYAYASLSHPEGPAEYSSGKH